MRRALLLALTSVAAAAAAPGPAQAARECQGLPVCIPVPGPWVAVPAPSPLSGAGVQYLLSCPRGSVVAGTDAQVTDRALDVSFLGSVGSPVGPGVTTHASAAFLATYTGRVARPSGFRPFLGCVPAQGGGGRSTTSFALAAFPPGQPLVRRAITVHVRAGGATTAFPSCHPGERLIGATQAMTFPQKTQPPIEWLQDARAARRVVDGRMVVLATRGDAIPQSTRVDVQVQSLCGARP